jgi:hypothetical protein
MIPTILDSSVEGTVVGEGVLVPALLFEPVSEGGVAWHPAVMNKNIPMNRNDRTLMIFPFFIVKPPIINYILLTPFRGLNAIDS